MMKDQKGTSLVSVIVSFAMLMIVMLLLQVSISASGRYAAEADKVWGQAVTAENQYTNGEGNLVAPDVEFKMKSAEGGEEWGKFTLTIKETNTEYNMYYVK